MRLSESQNKAFETLLKKGSMDKIVSVLRIPKNQTYEADLN